MNEIGERIKKLRKDAQASQLVFAKALGINRAHISRIETGSAKPSIHLIKLICAEFDVNEDWILNGKGEIFSGKPIDKKRLIQFEKESLANHLTYLRKGLEAAISPIKTITSITGTEKDYKYKPLFRECAAPLTGKDKNVILLKEEISKARTVLNEFNKKFNKKLKEIEKALPE